MSQQPIQVSQAVISEEDEVGQRIDNYLVKKMKGVPKSRIYRALRQGEIRVNSKRVKPHYQLQLDDIIRIPPLRLAQREPKPIHYRQLDSLSDAVIYEDNSLIIMNKPSGIAVHGGSGLSFGVIEGIRQLRPEEHHLELVHRIDRDTSGCLMIAKKRSTLRQLHQQFTTNKIQKNYLLLVHGECDFQHKTIDAALVRNHLQSGERLVKVDASGKASKTKFSVVKRAHNCTLLMAKPVTGRTHQIRVHAKYLGHPIVGDSKYGDSHLDQQLHPLATKRLYLHAASLAFSVNEVEMGFCACLDYAFQTLIASVGS